MLEFSFFLEFIYQLVNDFYVGQISQETILLVQNYQHLIASSLVILSGEIGIQIIGFFVGLGVVNYSLFATGIMTILVYDSIVFFIITNAKKSQSIKSFVNKIPWFIRLSEKFNMYIKKYHVNLLYFLLIIRILPFSKLTIGFFIAYTNWSYKRFLLNDLTTIGSLTLILGIPSYLAGSGVLSITEGKSISIMVLIFILVIALLFFLAQIVNKVLFKYGVRLFKNFK